MILHSFPERDRGIIGAVDDTTPDLIEYDPVEAAAKAAKIKQKAMFEAKKEREARSGKNYVSKSVRFKDDKEDEEYGAVEGSDMEDEEFDENEMLYDSEEEDMAERKFRKGEKPVVTFMINNKPANLMGEEFAEDSNKATKKLFKPVDGVKFTQYDEFGLPIGSDLRQFISTDNFIPDFFI